MDTLLLTDLTPKIKADLRDRLYFDRYRFAMSFYLRGVGCLRGLDGSDLEQDFSLINHRFEFRNKLRNYGGNWRSPLDDTQAAEAVQNLQSFLQELSAKMSEIHLTFSVDWAYVYSNDLNWLVDLSNLHYLDISTHFREAVLDRPRNTVRVANSNNSNRSYFRECRIEPNIKESLRSFLTNQENIRLGPSFAAWLNDPDSKFGGRWLQRHYFFDHDNDQIPTMLALIAPRLIRSTVQVLTK